MLRRRAVVVHRRTELDELLDRHATRGQAEFFLRSRGRSLADVQARHDAVASARSAVAAAIPAGWARADVERADLSRFLVAPEDVVVVVGQDGLVANVAKYLTGQAVLGVNPEPGTNPGVLVRHDVARAVRVLARLGEGDGSEDSGGDGSGGWLAVDELTTVRADLDDGQHLTALNEVFVGHASHQSARYRLDVGRATEAQSSSGLIVSTGTGATGWCASIARERTGGTPLTLPGPQDPKLAWFVREAWPSPATGTSLTAGLLGPDDTLRVTVAADQLVVFGDGMESDRLVATWGQTITVRVGTQRLRLVR